MNEKSVKTLLRGACGLFIVATIGLPTGLIVSHDGFRVRPPIVKTAPEPSQSANRVESAPTAEQLDVIWQRQIQPVPPTPPVPSVKKQEPAEAPQSPPPRITLLATAVNDRDAANSRAVLLDADGQVVVRRVDGSASGARVVRIETNRVVLEHNAREFTLALPEHHKLQNEQASARRERH